MVRTGARAQTLRQILSTSGAVESASKPSAPRLEHFPTDVAESITALYRRLGGVLIEPRLAPGSWDLAFDGLVVELDEEMHFHRYRALTLNAPWAARLPWTDNYRVFAASFEKRAGTGGKRWTNPSAERMFGPADPDGIFDFHGSPRWRQRALYDAMKDASAAAGLVRLARISIYDRINGVLVNDILYGRAQVEPTAMKAFFDSRTVKTSP